MNTKEAAEGYLKALIGDKEKPKKRTVRIWSSKERFIEYLEATLIPDFIESGFEATAEDFETAVYYLKGGK